MRICIQNKPFDKNVYNMLRGLYTHAPKNYLVDKTYNQNALNYACPFAVY